MSNIFSSDLYKPAKVEEYADLQRWIGSLKDQDDWMETIRWYVKNDLFYSLNFVLSSASVVHTQTGELFHYNQFFLDMCRQTEWQVESGSGLDCSARGGGKSEVRSKALPISLILKYPDISILILSAEKQFATRHLRKIKQEFDTNHLLQSLFSEILWQDGREALKEGVPWGMEEGLCVKRKIVRSNLTVETSAFYGTSPVGSRYDVILADDIEMSKYVNSEESALKLRTSFSEMVSLATPVALPHTVIMISNTRFSRAGLIQEKMDQYSAIDPYKVRSIPGEDIQQPGDGPLGGTPIYPFTLKTLQDKWNEYPTKDEYSLQIALDYTKASDYQMGRENIQWYKEEPFRHGKDKIIYINIDASRGIQDPTFIWVWGMGQDKRFYWLDAARKKMDPSKPEFYNEIYMMVKKWQDLGQRVAQVRVEQMSGSMWADLVRTEMQRRGLYAVPVVASTNPGKKTGKFSTGKLDRIYARWSPYLNRGDIVFPISQQDGGHGIMAPDETGKIKDLVEYFLVHELDAFPRCSHDDGLDSGGLIWDEKLNEQYPLQWGSKERPKVMQPSYRNTSWMSA